MIFIFQLVGNNLLLETKYKCTLTYHQQSDKEQEVKLAPRLFHNKYRLMMMGDWVWQMVDTVGW